MSNYIKVNKDEEIATKVSDYIWSRYNKDYIMSIVEGLKVNPRPTPQGVKIDEGILYDIEGGAFILSKARQEEILGDGNKTL